ncbi:MAG: acyl-CoA thioesterase [Flavobacteriales bacterium]|nr:acyl-CoA thioesterase [Flavobacteriales bacterium]
MTHKTRIPVRFADIDAMGHVNNAVFLSYFEQARIDFFNTHVGGEWDWKDQGIVLARNEIDYMIPILLNDDVWIQTEIERYGTKSMTMGFTVYDGRATDAPRIFAKGRCVLVAFDYHAGITKPLPEEWKATFQAD